MMIRTARMSALKALRAALITTALAAPVVLVPPGVASAVGPPVFINEIHYDNAGADADEGVEIAGPAGTNLAGWSVELYNGSNNLSYGTVALSGTIPDQQAGFGTLEFPILGIQNGAPDGLALVDAGSAVVEFLSYEGSFIAGNGPANGMLSIDIGVSESSSTPLGDSLQRTGTGTMGGDFTWAPAQPDTFGAVNTDQTFVGGTGGPSDPVINEFVANHTGVDTEAFIEVLGDPSTDYSDFTILEIEGDTSTGTIDAALNVGTTDGGGYWLDDEDMENGTITILLVEGFTGSTGDDIDGNDDGTIDSTPWTRIVDDIATNDGGGGDLTYSSTVLTAFYDGLAFSPGGASRIPNGNDTNATGDWVRNDFDGFGFVGFPGSPIVGEAENTPGATNVAISVATDPVGVCGDPATMIHDIQGAGAASPDVGNIREIEGVVVGDFQGFSGLGGFNVQEEDGQIDGNSMTSEGIFVFDGAGAVDVAVGDVVRVRGTVAEFFNLTEITSVATVTNCGTTGTASSATVNLPVASLDEFEQVEGMAVDFPQTLYASGNFTQARFGEVDLSVGGPLDNPTNVAAPGAAANAVNAQNDLSRIQLDDGSTVQNPLPLPPYLGPGNTLRTGDSVDGVSAVMHYSFGAYEIHPTAPVDFTRNNLRTGVPDVGGSMTVAAYNVLNYFTSIDNAGPNCGPDDNLGCRGADTVSEFQRQRAKIVDAIVELDADVIGLMEIENPSLATADEALDDLIAGLNDVAGAGTYAAIDTGTIGSDAIKVALIYKPASVSPVGAYAILDSSVDPTFNDQRNRPALAQTFQENGTDDLVTVAVNHLKSKGSPCDDIGDPDIGDQQGNCNQTRTSAAVALANWLAGDPTGSGSPENLIIGDLNAYAQEDPITALESAGYTDLIEAFVGTGFADGAYSFNFFSESGYLDHALASPSALSRVTGADFWHINADEPSGLDYNNFNQPGLYNPDEFRSSDHDPVIVGLCETTPPVVDVSVSPDVLWPPNNKYRDVAATVAVTDADPNPTVTVSVTSNEPDSVRKGDKPNDIVIVDDTNFKLRAQRLGTGTDRVYTITYDVTDACGNSTIASATVTVPHDQGN